MNNALLKSSKVVKGSTATVRTHLDAVERAREIYLDKIKRAEADYFDRITRATAIITEEETQAPSPLPTRPQKPPHSKRTKRGGGPSRSQSVTPTDWGGPQSKTEDKS